MPHGLPWKQALYLQTGLTPGAAGLSWGLPSSDLLRGGSASSSPCPNCSLASRGAASLATQMLWGQIIAVPEPCPSADFLGAERTPSCGHGGLAPRPGGAGEAFPHAGHGTLPYFPTPSISPQNNPPSHIPGSQRTPSRAGGRLFSQSPAHELTSPSANPRRCNWDVSDIQVKTKPTSSCFAFLRRNHLFPQILFRLLKAIGCSRAPRTSWGA